MEFFRHLLLMRRTLTLTRAQIAEAARVRRAGFLDAILAIARPDDEQRLVIHTCDWHALTRQFTTTGISTPPRRPCRKASPP